ncbi:MAG: hypothetical protein ABI675_03055 [Chitinophagaceae bacterium]
MAEQLASLPIREKQGTVEYGRLLRALQDGEVKQVTLEKTFVPVQEINQYVIVEHLLGKPFTDSPTHKYNEISGHMLFEDAQRSFKENVNNRPVEMESTVALRELLLVGKYESKPLVYNKDGELDKTSGINLDFALTLPGKSYSLYSARDPYKPVIVREKLFALVDTKSQAIQLYDGSLNKIKLTDFWKQVEGPSLNKVKIPPKDEEINLLPKYNVNHNKGLTK